ncbi:S-layer homology domain-containing protein [Patescibacteria group bacterium]|nr:S-layer homology domain-containing protein [Patescibacteria group bacterium]MBU1702965.1 S-layer homology domain-containing protein [Patescibacteria group bacterium]
MKKNIISLFTIILLTTPTVFAFNDVLSNHNYSDAIEFIKSENIVQGYPDGSFKPDNTINRAELLKIIIGAKYSTIEEIFNNNCFKDVQKDQWYTKYICFAKDKNIVSGYPDGSFKPEQNVNFVEAMKIAMKAYNISFNENSDPWYKDLVNKSSESNLIPLEIAAFDLNISRGQMTDIITRLIKSQNGTLETYLDNAKNIRQTFEDIQNGNNNLINFINRHKAPITFTKEGCNQNHFNASLIYLHKNSDNLDEIIPKLKTERTRMISAFAEATQGLAKLDVATEIFTINVDTNDIADNYYDKNLNWTEKDIDRQKVTKIFYQTHKDDYDFLIILKSFETLTKSSNYVPILEITNGIGMPPINETAYYGSQGKLKGFLISGITENISRLILHELSHQWGCYVGDPFSRGKNNAQIEICDTRAHILYVGSPFPTFTPLGANHWSSNGDGTYRIDNNYEISSYRYHPFTLYFMGLLPKEEYSTKYPIYDRGILGEEEDKSENATLYKELSVNDIIAVEGERTCE